MATTSRGEAPESSVEMSNLEVEQSQPQPQAPQQTEEPDTTAGAAQTEETSSPSPTTSKVTPTPRSNRLQSEAGLGPATDSPIAPPLPSTDRGPTLSITLLLITGARHPYKIDEKYLTSRKVQAINAETGVFDPREISGYKLKELIWTDWRSEWEPRPASPSSIRLIILGRLLEDKVALREAPFKLEEGNIVHMTVKPADFGDDDDTGGKGAGKGHSIRGRDGEDRGAGCRCVIL